MNKQAGPSSTRPNAEYKGELSFVAQDPSRPQTDRERYAVSTHVQGRYRQWRRNAKSKPRQANKPVTPILTPHSNVEEIDSEDERVLRDEPKPTPEPQDAKSGLEMWPKDTKRHTLPTPGPSPRSPKALLASPLPVANFGNSDPFNSCPIPIGPKETEVLLFYYQNVVPIFTRYIEAMGIPSDIGRSKWHDPFSALQDKAEAYGFLARSAVFMSRNLVGNDRFTTRALTYRNKSSELLRSRLASREHQTFQGETSRTVSSLLITAVVEESFDAALVHAKLLNFLLREQIRMGDEADPGLVFVGLWYDLHRATMTLTRPALELAGWVSKQLLPSWQEARRSIPPLSGIARSGLDPQITDQPLRRLLTAIREFLEILGIVVADPERIPASTLLSLAGYITVCQCHLVNRYLDVLAVHAQSVDSNHPNPNPTMSNPLTSRPAWQASTTAYASIAAIYWTRQAIKVENVPVGSARVFNAGKTLLPALRRCVTAAETYSNGLDAQENARLRLWALYIGAMAEQAHDHGHGQSSRVAEGEDTEMTRGLGWFAREFAAQVIRMGLAMWSDVRRVLQGFLYSDSLQPHGSSWVVDVVRKVGEEYGDLDDGG